MQRLSRAIGLTVAAAGAACWFAVAVPAAAQRGATYQALTTAQEELKALRGEVRRQRNELAAARRSVEALREEQASAARRQEAEGSTVRERIERLEAQRSNLVAILGVVGVIALGGLLLALGARRARAVEDGEASRLLAERVRAAEARLRSLRGE